MRNWAPGQTSPLPGSCSWVRRLTLTKPHTLAWASACIAVAYCGLFRPRQLSASAGVRVGAALPPPPARSALPPTSGEGETRGALSSGLTCPSARPPLFAGAGCGAWQCNRGTHLHGRCALRSGAGSMRLHGGVVTYGLMCWPQDARQLAASDRCRDLRAPQTQEAGSHKLAGRLEAGSAETAGSLGDPTLLGLQ